MADSPSFNDGFLKTLFGDGGKTSIRASYGIFYTAFPGLTAGIMYGVPPFGYNYLSSSPPLFSTPFITASNGTQNTDPFPLNFPPASNLFEQINPFNESITRVISSFDMKHNFVATYNYVLPFDRFFRRNSLTEGWSISGTTRFNSGLPVTLFDDSDRSLLGTLGDGVNNQLLDTPEVTAGALQINTDPRNGRPEFNTSLFAPEALGQLGNAARRSFYGSGIENFDMQLSKAVQLTEGKSLDIRIEAFNVFNHAQFYGPASVEAVLGLWSPKNRS